MCSRNSKGVNPNLQPDSENSIKKIFNMIDGYIHIKIHLFFVKNNYK